MKAKFFLLFFYIYLIISFNFFAQNKTDTDSLDNTLSSLTGSGLVEKMSELCWENLYTNTDKSFKYAKLSIKEILENKLNDSLLAASYNDLGSCYLVVGNYDTAMIYLDSSLSIRIDINDIRGIMGIRNKKALIYHWRGQYEKAIVEQKQVIAYFKKAKDTLNLANAFNNLGELNYELGNYIKAAEIHTENLNYRIAAGDSVGFAATLHNLGNALIDVGDTIKGLFYLDSSLTLFKQYGREDMIASVYHNTGTIFYRQGKLNKGKKRLIKAIDMLRKLGYTRELASSLNTLGEIYRIQKKHKLALKDLHEALALATTMDSYVYKAYAYQYLSRLYEDKQIWDSAFYYSKLLGIANAEVLTQESTDALHKYQVKYDTEKKEAEIEQLTNEAQINDLKLSKTMNLFVFSIFGALLIIISIILIFSRIRYKQKALIAEEKRKQQHMRFRAVIGAEENERKRIAQELHDGLGQVLSAAKLNMSAIEDKIDVSLDKVMKNSLNLIDQAVIEVRGISHNLMPNALVSLGLIPAIKEQIHMINDSGKIKIHSNFPEGGISLKEEEAIALYRAMQEIINNSIKYADAENVWVNINRSREKWEITIRDDGKGFDTTTIENSEGIGWKNIISRVDIINGKLYVDSKPEAGTKTKITIAI